MSIQIFNANLTTSFAASTPFVIGDQDVVLDLTVVIAGAPTGIRYFLEFAKLDPNLAATPWFRETDEDDTGGGTILQSLVVRNLRGNGGGLLAVGTHRLSLQFKRRHLFCRLQVNMAAGGGTASLLVESVFGRPALTAA